MKKIKIPKTKLKIYTGNSFSRSKNSIKKLMKLDKLIGLTRKK